MATPKSNQVAKKDPYANVTRKFLLDDVKCSTLFENFHEDAQNGTIVAIAGDNYAIIAADGIHSDETKQTLHRISNRIVLATTGSQCDTAKMSSTLRARLFVNEHKRCRQIPPTCIALFLSCMLTNQPRFHRNHVSIMMAGLDEKGKGIVYAYDPLGNHVTTPYRAMGLAAVYLQPILQRRFAPHLREWKCNYRGSELLESTYMEPKVSFDEAFKIVECAYKKASERNDIYTGNVLVIDCITKDGIFKHEIILKDGPPNTCTEKWL